MKIREKSRVLKEFYLNYFLVISVDSLILFDNVKKKVMGKNALKMLNMVSMINSTWHERLPAKMPCDVRYFVFWFPANFACQINLSTRLNYAWNLGPFDECLILCSIEKVIFLGWCLSWCKKTFLIFLSRTAWKGNEKHLAPRLG